jgi:GT2 family glycosyltransferase
MIPFPNHSLRTAFYRSGERMFCGYVVNTDNPNQRFAVEIFIDGYPVEVVRSANHIDELEKAQIGDGCYGFSYALSKTTVYDSAVVEARLANLGTVVGAPIYLSEPYGPADKNAVRGTIKWIGGLRFSGWISPAEEPPIGNILVDGTLITRARATKWMHDGSSEADTRAVPSFDLYLPEKFADGRVHQLVVTDDTGEDLCRPVAFIAYADGLCAAISGPGVSEQDVLRARLFDRLFPNSLPFSSYQQWHERLVTPSGPSVPLSAAVIMTGTGTTEDTLESLNGQIHENWIAGSLPGAEDCVSLRPELAAKFLIKDAAGSDFVVFVLAGTSFMPNALQRIASAFATFPEAEIVYGDVDLRGDDGSLWPLALPAFDYERVLEQGYCAYLFAMRRDVAARSLAAGPTNLYRLFNYTLDHASAATARIVHLPGSLAVLPPFDKEAARPALAAAAQAHLQRRGIRAQATYRDAGVLPAVHIKRARASVAATVVIPTRNRGDLLRSCIESIAPAVARTNAQILIVDNDTSDSETLGYLAEVERRGATILKVEGEFNFSRLCNSAADTARSDVMCLLNNDVTALDDHWLDEMLCRIMEPDVGAVGALLTWPSGVVQHGGIVLGPGFAAGHAFSDRSCDDPGYGDLLRVAHECSAVTGACLVTRRSDFLAVRGMDEVRFPINYNDVDYCLKLRAMGKRIVLTPHARLIHLEAASRGPDVRLDQQGRFARELQNLRTKWGTAIAADPYYNPLLSLDGIPFSALAWPPGPMEPRVNGRPIAVNEPPGF